jgi:hypothetical protein
MNSDESGKERHNISNSNQQQSQIEDGTSASSVVQCDREQQVAKSVRGLVLGGPVPGAFDIRARAHGEVPIWVQDSNNNDDDDSTDWNQASSMNVNQLPIARNDDEETGGEDKDEDLQDDIFVVVLARMHDDLILIEGVTVAGTTTKRQFCLLVGFLLLLCLIALVAALITNLLRSSGSASKNNNTTSPISPTMAPTFFRGNLNVTLAMHYEQSEGQFFSLSTGGQLFLKTLNRTDTNFTVFDSSREASLLEGVDISLIAKMASPAWDCHIVSRLPQMIQTMKTKDTSSFVYH